MKKKTSKSILAANTRAFREELELSQVDLADIIGCSHSRISEIENARGGPTLLTLDRLAKALRVTVAELFQ